MELVMVGLWGGSITAGWLLFWPWLAVPVAVIGLYIARVNARMRAMRRRNGLPEPEAWSVGSMTRPNTVLFLTTIIQHLLFFGAGAGVHWLIG